MEGTNIAAPEPTVERRGSDAARWEDLVKRCPGSTVFHDPRFLKASGAAYDTYYAISKDGVIEGGALVVLGPHGATTERRAHPSVFPLAMYQGVILSDAVLNEPAHRSIQKALDVEERLLHAVASDYDVCCLSTPPSRTDVRAYSWFNYHEPDRGRFAINVSYTAIAELAPIAENFDTWLRGIRSLRLREYKKANGKVVVRASEDVMTLDVLHEKSFARQGMARPAHESESVRSIAASALREGYGQLWVADVGGQSASALLVLHHKDTAYYMFGANDPEYRDSGASTYLMIHALKNAADAGYRCFDFVGANSPARGDYKASFNGLIHPYFVASWNRSLAPHTAQSP